MRSRGEMLCGFALLVTALLAVVGIDGASKPVHGSGSEEVVVFPKEKENYPRNLFISPNTTTTTEIQEVGPERIGMGGEMGCSKDSILVFQGATSPLPSGIPTYSVNVENVCLSESCSISDIHLSCGWFSSARTINPTIFRRLNYDDCLVNDGQPLNPGESISFQYANTFPYPLSVSSVSC
ncbi:TPD1 protein homolog 1-like [Salvia miltiorrhiza]|uniref:TPD1 protein homolog 1-like n=1 Tax=Salvia miltiorrhiza TaxID=226208 RepID=UPI0025AD2F84|nr:TPD1 protein homolog 1-like [Salvia miltiorrhiza]